MSETTSTPAPAPTPDPLDGALSTLRGHHGVFKAKHGVAAQKAADAREAQQAADAARHDLDGATAAVEADRDTMHKLIDQAFATR